MPSDPIRDLLAAAAEQYRTVERRFEENLGAPAVPSTLQVGVKNLLENLRSALDYLAHELFDSCCTGQRKPKKIYFHIATKLSAFNNQVDHSFPSLRTRHPRVVEALYYYQPVHSQACNKWVEQFRKLTNTTKHEALLRYTRQSRVVGSPGCLDLGGVVLFDADANAFVEYRFEGTTINAHLLLWQASTCIPMMVSEIRSTVRWSLL